MSAAKARSAVDSEDITVTVGGTAYFGWTEARVERAIDRMSSHLDLTVSERWFDQPAPWQLKPFDPLTVSIGKDRVLTGFCDEYHPEADGNAHTVRIIGRSRTEDLIDCTPDVSSGQFRGYKLDAVARTLSAMFNIDLVVETDVGDPFPDATIQRHETAFQFIERLCRLRSVLACDDELGRLVLTRAGAQRAAGTLKQGVNIHRMSARLSSAKRFSEYRVKTTMGESSAIGGVSFLAGFDGSGNAINTVAQTPVRSGLQGVATDPGVPRYRPHVVMAETGLSIMQAQARADWQMRHNLGRSAEAEITVRGWRQDNGALWRINQLIAVNAPFLNVNADLLIARVRFNIGRDGKTTQLTVGPLDAYTPDPSQVRLKRGKKVHGGGINLAGFDAG